MIDICEIPLTEDTMRQLIGLSRAWVEEDCSFGMAVNGPQDLHAPVFAALEGEKIIGYTYGHSYVEQRGIAPIPAGGRCFEVDELYVLPDYRSQGIGGRLFAAIEAYAKTQAQYITLTTSTKDYKRALNFYAERNGMVFHDAFLTKQL